MAKPNIIYFHTHDMGRWITPYGFNVETPNFTRFADRALLFRKAFCAAPTCSPSRAALLTGCSPHSVNVLGLIHRGFGPVDKPRHLSSFLKENGYETALSGIQHEANDPAQNLSYDHVLNSEPRPKVDRDLTAATYAVQWLETRNNSAPFFLALGMCMPHREFPEPSPNDNQDRLTPPYPVSDTPEGRKDFAAYRAAVAIADSALGMLMDKLDQLGLWENTIVVVTTDHGPAFPHMKCNLLDLGMGVTLMWHAPGLANPGRATDAMVSQIDVFPTLCELADLPVPEWVQGTSLRPVLEDPSVEIRTELFGEVTYHAAYEPMRAIRTQRYKLIKRYDPERLRTILPNVDCGPERERLIEYGWQSLPHPPVALYDLATDPFETQNRAEDPLLVEVRADLESRLLTWMEKTGDPLLIHCPRVPAPPGSKVTSSEGMSPDAPEREPT